MVTKSKFSKLCKLFGLVYLISSCLILVAMTIIMVLFAIKAPELIPGAILLSFPILGIFVGHWIRKEKYGWWRIVLMALSFIFFGIFLLFIFLLAPNLKDLETRQAAPKADAFEGVVTLNGPTQRFFMGVYSSDINTVKEYLEEGFNVDAVNERGSTALHVVQDKEIIQLLISSGADVNALDDYGMTPMFSKDVYLVKMLVEDGADVNVRSEDGNTPLIWYAYSGYQEGIAYMISIGADINAVNNDGSTAYDIAERFEHLELLEYLKTQGAKSKRKFFLWSQLFFGWKFWGIIEQQLWDIFRGELWWQ